MSKDFGRAWKTAERGAAALDAAAARRAATWQQIETAPKDGTLVLITDGDTMEVAKNYGAGWTSGDGLDFGYGAWDEKLTHWMPLPPPPKAKE